jgi:hypothetical protein
VRRKQNIRYFSETLSRVGKIFLVRTKQSNQSNIGFLTYLFPWLILFGLNKRGDESKTQSTDWRGVLRLANSETSCRGGIPKTVVEIHGGKQIGTDSQLEGYSLIH